MARRPGARLGERNAAAVGVKREDNRTSDVVEGRRKMRWCEESRIEYTHTHTHTLTESRERQVRGNTPAETLRPAKLPSAKPPPATASSCCGGRRLPATPTWLPGNYLQYTYEPSIVYFTQARQHASEWLLPCMSWQAKRRVHRMTDSRHIHCDSKVTGA